mgnify:CR=1 FL=1
MHALVGEGEGEADAEGARAVDARVAGAGVGGAVADAARVVCAPAAGATGMTTTGPADGTDGKLGPAKMTAVSFLSVRPSGSESAPVLSTGPIFIPSTGQVCAVQVLSL